MASMEKRVKFGYWDTRERARVDFPEPERPQVRRARRGWEVVCVRRLRTGWGIWWGVILKLCLLCEFCEAISSWVEICKGLEQRNNSNECVRAHGRESRSS